MAGFQLSRGLIGQQAGLPAQAQPGVGQSNLAPAGYTSQQYNAAYPTGQGGIGSTPGSTMSAGVAPYNNMQPQMQPTNQMAYNTALKPEGDGNGFGADSIQAKGPQPLAPKPKAASGLSLGSNTPSNQTSRS